MVVIRCGNFAFSFAIHLLAIACASLLAQPIACGIGCGPFAKNGAWGRYVGEYTSTWDSSLNSDNNVIWIDQIVISFPFDDFEAKLGIMGNNGAKSKDPMGMLSGARTGWKEDYNFKFRGITRIRGNSKVMLFYLDEPQIIPIKKRDNCLFI